MTRRDSLQRVAAEIAACRACPRLVRWREKVAREKRAAYCEWTYWGRGVPGFGDARARVVVLGLAPAAHGGNRTGRVFTGDRSGDWLYGALHRAGFANQAESTSRDDGLKLRDAYVTASVRCAPPLNKPSRAEEARCRPYLERELALLARAKVVVCLGGIAFRALQDVLRRRGVAVPKPAPRFGHGVEVDLRPAGPVVVCSYHPSQQNTFTGRLTRPMFDRVFRRVRAHIGLTGDSSVTVP